MKEYPAHGDFFEVCGIGRVEATNHHHQVQFSSTNWNIASWRSVRVVQMVLKLWKC